MKIKEVYSMIQEIAPFETCEPWDNSGLLCGSMENEVTGILCALDISQRVVDEAIRLGVNLIVSHHPILFSGRKNLREDDVEGSMLCEMIRSRLNVIAAHTNFDKAENGVNAVLAEKLGISQTSVIDESGFVRMGTVEPCTLSVFAEKVRQTLGDCVRVYGESDRIIKTVCVCGGAGGEFARFCAEAGADAYVTGEMRYHDSIDLAQRGFATLQAGHDSTEKFAVDAIKELLEKRINAGMTGVRVYRAKNDSFGVILN